MLHKGFLQKDAFEGVGHAKTTSHGAHTSFQRSKQRKKSWQRATCKHQQSFCLPASLQHLASSRCWSFRSVHEIWGRHSSPCVRKMLGFWQLRGVNFDSGRHGWGRRILGSNQETMAVCRSRRRIRCFRGGNRLYGKWRDCGGFGRACWGKGRRGDTTYCFSPT